jgi:hypothetical protein
MKIEPYQVCRTSEGWTPVQIASSSSSGSYTVMVAPWGHPRENICECPGYVFTGKCRHQEEAMDRVCGWTELQVGDYQQTKEQRANKECPRCHGETLWRMEIVEDE